MNTLFCNHFVAPGLRRGRPQVREDGEEVLPEKLHAAPTAQRSGSDSRLRGSCSSYMGTCRQQQSVVPHTATRTPDSIAHPHSAQRMSIPPPREQYKNMVMDKTVTRVNHPIFARLYARTADRRLNLAAST